jgi:hypothetical protein
MTTTEEPKNGKKGKLKQLPVCIWEQDEWGLWQTSCKHEHTLIEGTPMQNNYHFCPHCGLKLDYRIYVEPPF